jgi:hypothetical protein
MDPTAIATAVIAALSPYLVKAGEEVAGDLGKNALAKGEAILMALWKRWEKKPAMQARLASYQADPAANRNALLVTLSNEIENEPDFASTLDGLLHTEQAEAYIRQVAQKGGELTGAKIREMLSGSINVHQTLADGGKAVGIEVERFGRR